jgi:hypothetical protein
MKKTGFIIILIAIIIVGFLIWQKGSPEIKNPELTLTEKQELVEEYLRENISELSPEKEVLGGNFYVTNIEFVANDSCLVDYEDGHIALRAEVNFQILENNQIDIIAFNLLDLGTEEGIPFVDSGNIVENNGGWDLIYEEPGAPALQVSLKFDENSICRKEGEEDQSCFPVYWKQGDRVSVEGKRRGEQVQVDIFRLLSDSTELNLEPNLESGNQETEICVDKCGDGTCQEMVCLGSGCPCAETSATCPQDCS